MLKQKRALSISIVIATLGLVGCGSKVAGTYTFSQSGMSNTACSNIVLNLTSNSNQVSANGSSGTCTETLTGYDNGNGTITVQSLTMTTIQGQTQQYPYNNYNNMSNQSCIYTGMLTVSGNVVSGTLMVQNTGMNYSNNCGTLTINGTKN
jgi:hypothetical protein